MKFPFVTRKKYDAMVAVAQSLCADVLRLEDERDAMVGVCCTEKHKFEDWQKIERSGFEQEREHFEAILTNLRREK